MVIKVDRGNKDGNYFYGIGLGIENCGVDPDIEVETKPEDYAQGRDVKVDKAIEIALSKL
ncbi:MAG: hypothetical protein RXR08_10695 [Sulfolobaceae archaeon]